MSGGTRITVTDSEGPFDFISGTPSISDSDVVAFSVDFKSGPETVGIVAGDGEPISVIVDDLGTFSGFNGGLEINESGTVAFHASIDGGGQGVFTKSGAILKTIADTDDPYSSFDGIGMNNDGDVIFMGVTLAGPAGIFYGSDPALDRIIQVGDSIDGAIVTGIDFFRGLGNSGKVAFSVSLSDKILGDYHAIYRADPMLMEPPVGAELPEPSSLFLLGSWIIVFGIRRSCWIVWSVIKFSRSPSPLGVTSL